MGVGALTLGAAGVVAVAAPAANVTTTSATAAIPVLTLAPRIPYSGGHGIQASVAWPGWLSTNWSGYAETSTGPYTGVSSRWTVPTLTCSGRGSSYSAAWAGIDGFNNDSLIQTGTEQDCSNLSASYSAWWTTSAQDFAEQPITTGCSTTGTHGCGTVRAGDTMLATISESTSGAGNASAPSNGTTDTSDDSGGQAAPPGANGPSTPSVSTVAGTTTRSATATTVNASPNPTTQGTPVTYSATVTGGASTPSGTVSFTTSSGATKLCTATLSLGTGSCMVSNAPVGTDKVKGAYSGDSTHAKSSGDTKLIVNKGVSGSPTWTLTLSDQTQGWTFTKTLSYDGPGASAEWILEAPTVGQGVATLADYGSTSFRAGTIDADANPDLTGNQACSGSACTTTAGEMMNNDNGVVISIPSAPDGSNDGFAVAFGSVPPATPPPATP